MVQDRPARKSNTWWMYHITHLYDTIYHTVYTLCIRSIGPPFLWFELCQWTRLDKKDAKQSHYRFYNHLFETIIRRLRKFSSYLSSTWSVTGTCSNTGSVTVSSSPLEISAERGLSKFGLVAFSKAGGFCM